MEPKYRDWFDITIKEYLDIEKQLKEYEVGSLKRLHMKVALLCGTTVDEVYNLSLEDYNNIIQKLNVFFGDIPNMTPLSSIEFDKEYKILYDLFSYSVERYSDIELMLTRKDVFEREIPLFCIMLKDPENEYNGNKLLMLEEEVGELAVPVFYSCLNFFLRNYESFKTHMNLSMIPMEEMTLETEVAATLSLLSIAALQTSIN